MYGPYTCIEAITYSAASIECPLSARTATNTPSHMKESPIGLIAPIFLMKILTFLEYRRIPMNTYPVSRYTTTCSQKTEWR